MDTPLAQTQTSQTYTCTWPQCGKSFPTPQGRSLHIIRVHTHRFNRKRINRTQKETLAQKREYNRRMRARVRFGKVPPSKTTERKHEYYVRHKERMAARGLNAHGEPYKVNPAVAANIRRSQQLRRAKEQTLLNGVQQPQASQDNMGEAARAIIVAAQVLRSVGIGLKI